MKNDTFARYSLFLLLASFLVSCATTRPDLEKYNEGLELSKQKQYAAALEKYQEVLILNPKLAVAANNAGATCYKMGDLTCAIGYFSRATIIRPDYPNAWYNLAVIHLKEDRPFLAYASALHSAGDDAIKLAVSIYTKLEREGLLFTEPPKIENKKDAIPQFPADIENGWTDWVEGEVDYIITVDEKGALLDKYVANSPAAPFIEESEKALAMTIFKPATDQAGKPIPAVTELSYRFSPDNRSSKIWGGISYSFLFFRLMKMKKEDLYRACFLPEFEKNQKLEGKLLLSFSTLPDGNIADLAIAESALKNEVVEQCVLGQVKALRFPPFKAEEGKETIRKYKYDYWFGFQEEEEEE